MSTITKKYLRKENNFQNNAPYGNLSVLHYKFTADSSGVMENSDDATLIAASDVLRVGILPAGSLLVDSQIVISNPFSEAVVTSMGFAYVDGVDVTDQAQSAVYFNAAGTSLQTAGVVRKNGVVAPKTLPKDAYLTLTIGAVPANDAAIIDIFIYVVAAGVNR